MQKESKQQAEGSEVLDFSKSNADKMEANCCIVLLAWLLDLAAVG